jgi:biopolymer transport protein ExbD
MRRRRPIPELAPPAHINIVPLLDVLFAVLTFFIMSSLLLTKLETLTVSLPKAKNAQPQLTSKASLTINAQGELFLNRQPIPASQIVAAVTRLQQPDQPLTIVLNADRSINYGSAVEVLDQVRQVPGVKIAIATTQPVSQPEVR